MMARIRVEVDKRLDKGYPDKRASSVEIALADGRRFTGHIDNAKGEPECPLSAVDIENKFLMLTGDTLAGGSERVRDLVMRLETLQDVNALAACLKAEVRSCN
jgi:2-methylcitrate dehydratase PrpD